MTPKEQNKHLATMLYEECNFRFSKIIWLASALADDSHFDALEDMFYDAEMNKIARIFDLPETADADEGIETSDLAELLNNHERWGFVAEVLIPRKTFVRPDALNCSFSKGSCYVKHTYAESTEDLVTKAQALEKEMEEVDRAKAGKK